MKYDVVFVGYAVNSSSGGYVNREVKYIDTVRIKYLYSDFYGTYCAEPVAFLQIAAQIRKAGFSVYILDGLLMGYDLQEMKERLENIDADLFCFSLYESSKSDVLILMKYVKSMHNNSVIATGGPYVTLHYKEILAECSVIDYITIGDGDLVYIKLLTAIKNQIVPQDIPNLVRRVKGKIQIDAAPQVVDLNCLENLERDFSEEIIDKGFSFSIIGSRGCGHGICSFCYLPEYQKISKQPKIRYRKPELIVDEIKDLVKKYNINKVTFIDEDFFGSNGEGIKHACSIFKMINKEKIKIKIYVNARVNSIIYLIKNNLLDEMVEAGLAYLFIGFESYNDNILKKYHKAITTKDIDLVCNELIKRGIKINPGLITFDPELNPYEVKNNVDLLKRIEYYDAFMFTRTLVQNTKENKNTNKGNTYFKNEYTSILYNYMVLFRDKIYELYKEIDPKKLSEKTRAMLIDIHFDYFYRIYNAIIKEQGSIISDQILNDQILNMKYILENTM